MADAQTAAATEYTARTRTATQLSAAMKQNGTTCTPMPELKKSNLGREPSALASVVAVAAAAVLGDADIDALANAAVGVGYERAARAGRVDLDGDVPEDRIPKRGRIELSIKKELENGKVVGMDETTHTTDIGKLAARAAGVRRKQETSDALPVEKGSLAILATAWPRTATVAAAVVAVATCAASAAVLGDTQFDALANEAVSPAALSPPMEIAMAIILEMATSALEATRMQLVKAQAALAAAEAQMTPGIWYS
jgi:hypothetical protein